MINRGAWIGGGFGVMVIAALLVLRPPRPVEQHAGPHNPNPAPTALPQPAPAPAPPPPIATGADYEHCINLAHSDPAEAARQADAWAATGGGDIAAQCHAMAVIALGQPEKGADELEKLAASSHGAANFRARLYGQADQAWLMAHDPSRAYTAATLALALMPDDANLRIDRSVAAASLNRFQDSVDDLNHVLANTPNRTDALVFRGAALRHLDEPDRARSDIDHALALDPTNTEALLERGILRQGSGDNAGARADWSHVIDIAPNSASADLARQNLALQPKPTHRKR